MSPKLPLTINTLKKYMYKPRVILSRVWYMVHYHGLRTPNEDINQRYLKNWTGVADKISFGRT